MATTSRKGTPADSGYILGLVQLALDEIDSVELAATIRRTVRIANLLNDTYAALRLGMEIKASGGHPPANAEATKRLMSDPSTWGQWDSVVELALNDFMEERRVGDDKFLSYSVAEMEFWNAERFDPDKMTDAQYLADLETRVKRVEILTRARHHAFTLLCAWERQLTFATHQEGAIDAVSGRVDAMLNDHAPEVLNQFNSAFRRLRDAAERDSSGEAAEELSQALTSCRRILKAVVDIVQPADPGRMVSEEGHALSDEHYKNRLVEFLKTNVESASFRTAAVNGGETLFDRFSAIDDLSSKGVHAKVAAEEAEYCALHTYITAGEVLLLHADRPG